jgi:hypothetical protein
MALDYYFMCDKCGAFFKLPVPHYTLTVCKHDGKNGPSEHGQPGQDFAYCQSCYEQYVRRGITEQLPKSA